MKKINPLRVRSRLVGVLICLSSMTIRAQTVTIGGGANITCPATPTATYTPIPTGITISNWSRSGGVTCASITNGIAGKNLKTLSYIESYNVMNYYSITISADALTAFALTEVFWKTSVSNGGASFTIGYSNNGGPLTVFGTTSQNNLISNTFSGTVVVTPGTSIVLYFLPVANNNGSEISLLNGSTVTINTYVPAVSDYFRSVQNGNWATASTWESSPDATIWYPATSTPTNLARGTVVRNGDTVTVASTATTKLLTIDAGGVLVHPNAIGFDITDTVGTDFSINGRYELNGTVPTYTGAGATVVVSNSAEVRVNTNSSGLSDNFARDTHVFFNSGLFNWNTSNFFEANGVTYFPNATSTDKAIFRVSKTIGSAGGGSATLINGKFEVANGASVTFVSSGIKIFRDGLGGGGIIDQATTCGKFQITSASAVIDGTLIVNLQQVIGDALEIASGAQVTISGSPVINVGSLTVPNVLFHVNGNLTHNGLVGINIANGIISVDGALSGTGKLIGSQTAKVTIGATGVAGISFESGSFKNYLKDLFVAGTASIFGDSLNITSGSSYGVVTVDGILNTNGFLVFRADVNGRAIIAKSSGIINGDAIVEVYVSGRRAWRLMTFPTAGIQTIHESLQEGGHDLVVGQRDNPKPGYGTHVTWLQSLVVSAGYDMGPQNNTSIQRWNGATNAWTTISSLFTKELSSESGYFIFIRGDRSTDLRLAATAPTSPTILESKGSVVVGTTVTNYSGVSPGGYVLYGNRYVCPIRIDSLFGWVDTNKVDINTFSVWDPKLAGINGVGGWVTYNGATIAPTSPTYGTSVDSAMTLQANQGVLFKLKPGITAASFTTTENAKTYVQFSGPFGRPINPTQSTVVRADLHDVKNAVIDGVAASMDKGVSIPKVGGSTESVFLVRRRIKYGIERGTLGDTFALTFTRLKVGTSYTLRFTKEAFGLDSMIIVDSLLKTNTIVTEGGLDVALTVGDTTTWDRRFFIFTKKKVADPIPDLPVDTYSIYPNPTTNDLFIDPPLQTPTPISITDMMGRVVWRGMIQSNKVNCSSLPRGMYILTVNGKSFKFVKN